MNQTLLRLAEKILSSKLLINQLYHQHHHIARDHGLMIMFLPLHWILYTEIRDLNPKDLEQFIGRWTKEPTVQKTDDILHSKIFEC